MEKEEEEEEASVKGKRKKEEEEEEASVKGKLTEPSEKKKKKGSKVAAGLTSGSLIVCLIIKMPLKTELWKLKTP